MIPDGPTDVLSQDCLVSWVGGKKDCGKSSLGSWGHVAVAKAADLFIPAQGAPNGSQVPPQSATRREKVSMPRSLLYCTTPYDTILYYVLLLYDYYIIPWNSPPGLKQQVKPTVWCSMV